MTLCAAWIRHGSGDEGAELVFATDSRLRGGEAWDQGLKLFDLGRTDCLLCFAGHTRRAYPLILQSMNSVRTDIEWTNPRIDLYDVLTSICTLFTRTCLEITDLPPGDNIHEVRAEAEFLFGGWSWREQDFLIWKIYYSPELQVFTHQKMNDEGDDRIVVFLGDEIDSAERLLSDDLRNSGKVIRGSLDMEPIRVLARMSRDDHEYPTIGGALQIGKIYRSGHNEYLGIMWQSTADGKPYFMGKEINPFDAPPIRFIDPDTTKFVEVLPAAFIDIDAFDFGTETRFIQDAYPNLKLKDEIPEAHRMRLGRIFHDFAYRKFVKDRESANNNQDPQTAQPEDRRTIESEEGQDNA
jgi:hypothetical protein